MSECEEAERLRSSCRVCLRNRGVLNIFLSHSALAKLRACAPIQISKGDGLPESICRRCADRLEGAYAFRERCLRSDRRLHGAGAESGAGAASAHLRSLLRTICARPDLQVKPCNVDLVNVVFQVKEEPTESIKKEDDRLHLVDDREKKVNISKELQEGERWKMKSIKTEDNKLHTVHDQEKKGIICKEVQDGERWREDGEEVGQGENEAYRCRIGQESGEGRQLVVVHERGDAERDAEYPCEFCGKTFHKYYIHKHVSNAHLKPKGQCSVCHKQMSVTTLSVHMRRHAAAGGSAAVSRHQESRIAPLHSTLKKKKKVHSD